MVRHLHSDKAEVQRRRKLTESNSKKLHRIFRPPVNFCGDCCEMTHLVITLSAFVASFLCTNALHDNVTVSEDEDLFENVTISTFKIKFLRSIIEERIVDKQALELALNSTSSEYSKNQPMLFCEVARLKNIYYYHGVIGYQYHYGINSLGACLYHCAAHNHEKRLHQNGDNDEECKAVNYFAFHNACQLLSEGIETLENADRRAYGHMDGAFHAFIQSCYGPDASSTKPTTQRPPTTPRPTTPPPTKGVCGVSTYPPSVEGYSDKTRIIRGQEARPNSWPWAILLNLDFGHSRSFCGGTLLRINDEVEESDIVLTAAHCVTRSETQGLSPVSLDPSVMSVIAGDHRRYVREEGEVHRRVKAVRIHSRFRFTPQTGAVNDISLLKLQTPIPFNDIIRPICLPNQNDPIPTGLLCIAAGWGRNDSRFMYVMPDALQQLVIPLQDASTCANSWGQIYNEKAMVCAGNLAGTASTCQGDSGGMLVCKPENGPWVQQGVTSFGVGGSCLEPYRPAVFTRVNSYVDWIQKNIIAMSASNKRMSLENGFDYLEAANDPLKEN